MIVYHYTSSRNWGDIKSANNLKKFAGLRRKGRLGQDYLPAWEFGAIFALSEARPESWVHNPDFPRTWDYLMTDCGSLLLEVEVDDQAETSLVVDRAHMEGFLYLQEGMEVPERYRHTDPIEAEKAYLESKVPLRDWLVYKDALDYSLPEILLTELVPLDRIRIPVTQEELELDLAEIVPIGRAKELERLSQIPELQPWYQGYLERRI